jgi:hypothetical protein
VLSRSADLSEEHGSSELVPARHANRLTEAARNAHVQISARIVAFVLRPRSERPKAPVAYYQPGSTRLGAALWRPAILGLVASIAILAGASQQNSPFTVKSPGAWWFGIPTADPTPHVGGPGQWLFVGVCAVYGGMILMLRAWYDIIRLASRMKGIPVAKLVPVFIAWTIPLLLVAPLFSQDAYSYAAQGELMSHHISPYLYGPGLLSTGNSFGALTAPMWRYVTSPYGPVFLVIDGWIVSAMHHNALASIEALRFLALIGVVMFAAAIPAVARSFHRDGATAFALAVLNPLILLNLIAGEHNDALMLGFLVVGYAVARRGHPILGVLLCSVAAAVKIPGFIGVIYIGWEWRGSALSVRERIRPLVGAIALGAVAMTAASEFAGVGWRWIAGLSNPDTVRSWLDPATAVGLLFGQVANVFGLGSLGHPLLTFARAGALALSVVVAVVLLLWSDRIGPLSAIGWSCIAVVVLGPVVQPWYLAWGVVFLAPIAEGRVRRFLFVISAISCFLGLPGGSILVNELQSANPIVIALFSLLLITLALGMAGPRVRALIRPRGRLRSRENPAVLAEPA